MSRGWVPTRPEKTGGFQQAKRWLAARLRPDPGAVAELSRPDHALAARAVAQHVPVTSAHEARATMTRLIDELVGLGPLAGFAQQPGVTDIIVDGQGAVWLDTGTGLHRTDTVLESDTTHALAVRLLGQGGKRLDAGMPFGDVQIGAARVHAVLPPIATAGPQLSIRLAAHHQPSLTELAAQWPAAPTWLNVLHHLLEHRANMLISGATGSGKTTLLAGLLGTVDPDQRILTIEDTPELRINHPHVVGLATREPNTEGQGAIGLPMLIRQALRMRPDRLIVGECRGAEVADFLAAMNTGHRGAIGTVHANSAGDVPARLNAMAALAGLDPVTTASQARSAIDVIIHLERNSAGIRHPVELAVCQKHGEGPHLTVIPALTTRGDQTVDGPGLALLDGLPRKRAA